MKTKDTAALVVLAQLGLINTDLTPEQEQQFTSQTNRTEEDDLLDTVRRLFPEDPKSN